MINTINNLDSLDFTESSASTIKLSESQVIEASELASSTEENKQWQNYLNNLALFGFQTWLKDRNSQYSLNLDNSQHIFNAVSCLEIGEFKICLLTQGILEDEVITIPQQVISEGDRTSKLTEGKGQNQGNQSDTIEAINQDIQVSSTEKTDKGLLSNLAHFYVLVTVDEEQEEVTIEGLIRYDQLNAYMQSTELTLYDDFTYDIFLNYNYFDADINHLLLYLRYLNPSAIQLPVSTSSTVTNPQLIQETVMNVASWLNGKLDELGESLSWILLPPPELATSAAFRNQSTTSIIDELRSEEIIPDGAKTVLKEIKTANLELQLYAITWTFPENKWALLLILKKTDDLPLPFGLKLQIKSEDEIIKEETFSYENEEDYLQTKVEGIINQQFTITISLNNQNLKCLIFP